MLITHATITEDLIDLFLAQTFATNIAVLIFKGDFSYKTSRGKDYQDN